MQVNKNDSDNAQFNAKEDPIEMKLVDKIDPEELKQMEAEEKIEEEVVKAQAKIIAQITVAFAGAKKVETDEMDLNLIRHPEIRPFIGQFRHWTHIDDSLLDKIYALHFVDKANYKFLLPAYLVRVVKSVFPRYYLPSYEHFSSTIWSLYYQEYSEENKEEERKLREIKISDYNSLNREQQEAVVEFLKFIIDYGMKIERSSCDELAVESAKEALEFWRDAMGVDVGLIEN